MVTVWALNRVLDHPIEMNQKIWWLEDIYVVENERGKGIGRRLISQMAKKGSLVLVQEQYQAIVKRN